jgi:hypothetical protein
MAVLLQIIIAPNFDAKCPDCNADLNCQNGKITFKKHSIKLNKPKQQE